MQIGTLGLAAALGAIGLTAPSGAAATATASNSRHAASNGPCGDLTVWTDETRLPAVTDFEHHHTCVHVDVTVFNNSNGALQTKIGLFNKIDSGWSDLLWDGYTTDAGWLDSTRYHYPVQLNAGLVPQSTLDQWADNSLSVCTLDGKVYCLRNDIGANVLWYNAPLMKQFGYTVPTTWAEYEALGKKLAAQHPGYVIGTAGDEQTGDAYFWPSGCPASEQLTATTVEIDTTAPQCTRVANMLDPLIKDGSISTLAVTSPDFIKQYGVTDKILMEIGPTWYGAYIFAPNFKLPNHTWAVADPLSWPNFDYTGDYGGGIWEVSSHADYNVQRLAVYMAEWMTTSPVYQRTAPTYPANVNAAAVWLKQVNSSGFYAYNPAKVFHTAATEIWPGWSALLFSTDNVWASTMEAPISSGKSLLSLLPLWGTALSNMAQTFGYTVVKS